MLASGLEINVPEITDLTKEVLIRHDIVHRAGRSTDGSLIDLTSEDLRRVSSIIQKFSNEIEKEFIRRFPKQPEQIEF